MNNIMFVSVLFMKTLNICGEFPHFAWAEWSGSLFEALALRVQALALRVRAWP